MLLSMLDMLTSKTAESVEPTTSQLKESGPQLKEEYHSHDKTKAGNITDMIKTAKSVEAVIALLEDDRIYAVQRCIHAAKWLRENLSKVTDTAGSVINNCPECKRLWDEAERVKIQRDQAKKRIANLESVIGVRNKAGWDAFDRIVELETELAQLKDSQT